jgi:hypothetical protein
LKYQPLHFYCLSVAEASPSLYNRQFGQKSGGEASRADCETERSEANREARSGNEGAYVPECDKNGEFFITIMVEDFKSFIILVLKPFQNSSRVLSSKLLWRGFVRQNRATTFEIPNKKL